MSATKEDLRPHTRTLLPIRVVRGLRGIELEYEADNPGPRGTIRQPYRHLVGDVDNPLVFADPLGGAVVKLIALFYEMEGQFDGLKKDRDEAIAAWQQREAEIRRLEGRVASLEGRLKKG